MAIILTIGVLILILLGVIVKFDTSIKEYSQLKNQADTIEDTINTKNLQLKELNDKIAASTNVILKQNVKFEEMVQALENVNKDLIKAQAERGKIEDEKLNLTRTMAQEREQKKEEFNKILEDYKAELDNEKELLTDCTNKLEEKLDERIDDKKQELSELNKQVEEYKNTIISHIEACRREEEKKLKQDFYKINLTKEDRVDIDLIRSIEDRLHNKEPINKVIWNSFYMRPLNELIKRVLPDKKVCGIYKITNLENDMSYIGQSRDVSNRFKEHIKSSLEIGTIAKNQLYSAMKTNGAENYSFELLEECPKEKLNEREKFWIGFYKTNTYGYNMTQGNK